MKLMKTLKKSISALLAGVMTVMSLSATAFAEYEAIEKESITMKIHKETISNFTGNCDEKITVKNLYDLDGNVFELVETGEKGYYIFDSVSGKYLEMAPEAPSPYLGLNQDIYYFGPMNYYHKVDGIFKHTVLSDTYDFPEEMSEKIQETFEPVLSRSRSVKDEEMLSLINRNVDNESIRTKNSSAYATSDDVYVPYYYFIKDDPYPANTSDTCGYVAACIVLSYWNRINVMKGKDRIIERSFLTSDGTLVTTGYTLQDELLSYDYPHSTTGQTISQVLNAYCYYYNINAEAYAHNLDWDVASDIKLGRPVILFCAGLPETTKGHAVVAYGLWYKNNQQKFIVNYGWDSSHTKIYLDGGIIGTNTKFRFK